MAENLACVLLLAATIALNSCRTLQPQADGFHATIIDRHTERRLDGEMNHYLQLEFRETHQDGSEGALVQTWVAVPRSVYLRYSNTATVCVSHVFGGINIRPCND